MDYFIHSWYTDFIKQLEEKYMYCLYCGKQIPDGGVCDCRANINQPQTPQMNNNFPNQNAPYQNQSAPYQPDMNYQPNMGYTPYNNYEQPPVSERAAAIKNLMGSANVLALAVIISLSLVLSIFGGIFGNSYSLISVVSILTLIAAWLVFSAGHNRNATPTSGLTICSGLLIAYIVYISLAFVLMSAVIIILMVNAGSINEALTHLPKNIYNQLSDLDFTNIAMPIFVILEVVIACTFIFALFYYIILRNNVVAIRSAAKDEPVVKKINLFPVILLFIGGASGILNAISSMAVGSAGFASVNDLLKDAGINYSLSVNYFGLVSSLLTSVASILEGTILLKARNILNR